MNKKGIRKSTILCIIALILVYCYMLYTASHDSYRYYKATDNGDGLHYELVTR